MDSPVPEDPDPKTDLVDWVASVGVEKFPMPDVRMDGPSDVSCGVMALLFPPCILEPITSDDKEIVIIEV